ncbi:MAG: hemolysin III family protein [Paracoccaceae bacterium]
MLLPARHAYSRAELVSDAVVHVSGVVAALIAVPVLITVTAFLRGDFTALFGISIYGATLLAMLGCSALFNMAGQARWRWLFQRLDHSAIYLKIAGTYTPFALLSGAGAGTLLAGIWGAALAGVGLKALSPVRFRTAALTLYLAMGWAGVFAGGTLLAELSPTVLALMVSGGVLYSAGVVFYLWERLPYHNTVWHVFVLAASGLFYAAILTRVVQST